MAANSLYRNYIIHPSPESGNTINPVVGLHDGLYEFDEAEIWNSNAASALEIKKMIPTSRLSKKVVRKIDKVGRTPVTTCASLPVNVPDWSKIYKDIEYREHRHQKKELGDGNSDDDDSDHYDDDDDDDQDGRVPPHEYLARRRGASFSVHEGVGRTLKGRDLRQVRNAIWKRVGFED